MTEYNLPEGVLLALYSYWSEETYCAGFLSPDEGSVQEFREWLKSIVADAGERKDYEIEFLEEYRRQERSEQGDALAFPT